MQTFLPFNETRDKRTSGLNGYRYDQRWRWIGGWPEGDRYRVADTHAVLYNSRVVADVALAAVSFLLSGIGHIVNAFFGQLLINNFSYTFSPPLASTFN